MNDKLRGIKYFIEDIPQHIRNLVYKLKTTSKRVKVYSLTGIIVILLTTMGVLIFNKTGGGNNGEEYTGGGELEFKYSNVFKVTKKGDLDLGRGAVSIIHDTDKNMFYKLDADHKVEESYVGSGQVYAPIQELPLATTALTYEEIAKTASKEKEDEDLVDTLQGNIVKGSYADGINYIKGLQKEGYIGKRYSSTSSYHEFVMQDSDGEYLKITLTGEYIIRGSVSKNYIRGTAEAEVSYIKMYLDQRGVTRN